MTTASAELIADDVSVIAGVSGVKVNPRTGSVIVFYDDACGLVPVAEVLFSSMRPKTDKMISAATCQSIAERCHSVSIATARYCFIMTGC